MRIYRLEEDVSTSNSIAVGAFTLVGICRIKVIAGTLITPPPIPKKLEIKPLTGDRLAVVIVLT